MNDNRNLITHIKTDPNASKHAFVGFLSSVVAAPVGQIFGGVFWFSIILFPLLSGITIEIIQRLQGGTNTNRESIMDAFTTWLWFIYYIVMLRK